MFSFSVDLDSVSNMFGSCSQIVRNIHFFFIPWSLVVIKGKLMEEFKYGRGLWHLFLEGSKLWGLLKGKMDRGESICMD